MELKISFALIAQLGHARQVQLRRIVEALHQPVLLLICMLRTSSMCAFCCDADAEAAATSTSFQFSSTAKISFLVRNNFGGLQTRPLGMCSPSGLKSNRLDEMQGFSCIVITFNRVLASTSLGMDHLWVSLKVLARSNRWGIMLFVASDRLAARRTESGQHTVGSMSTFRLLRQCASRALNTHGVAVAVPATCQNTRPSAGLVCAEPEEMVYQNAVKVSVAIIPCATTSRPVHHSAGALWQAGRSSGNSLQLFAPWRICMSVANKVGV